jgi:hypothetical protein
MKKNQIICFYYVKITLDNISNISWKKVSGLGWQKQNNVCSKILLKKINYVSRMIYCYVFIVDWSYN